VNDTARYLSDSPSREDGLKLDAFRNSLLDILLHAETPLTVTLMVVGFAGRLRKKIVR